MKNYLFLLITSYILILILFNTQLYRDCIEEPVDSFYAAISSRTLHKLGFELYSDRFNIIHKDFSMQVAKGCDAILPIAFLIITILLFPNVEWKSKSKGILMGLLLLVTLNFIRIISLFFIGLYQKDWFDFMHVEFWQIVFIVFGVLYFLQWMNKYDVSKA